MVEKGKKECLADTVLYFDHSPNRIEKVCQCLTNTKSIGLNFQKMPLIFILRRGGILPIKFS